MEEIGIGLAQQVLKAPGGGFKTEPWHEPFGSNMAAPKRGSRNRVSDNSHVEMKIRITSYFRSAAVF